MKKLFILFILIAHGANTQVSSKKRPVLDCLMDLQHSVEDFNYQTVIDVMQNIVETASYLNNQYQKCRNVLKDDPPTPVQQILYDACEAEWKAQLGIELTRLSFDIQENINTVIDLAERFSLCSGIVIPKHVHTK